MKKRILALFLFVLMCISVCSSIISCSNEDDSGTTEKPDALVLMSDELDGLFNPFYSTTAADGTIVSMTQIGMITTKFVNGEIDVAFGDDEAVVVKDYESTYDEVNDETTYTFVIKNGIKYSDGKPLTMHDVMFNLYVYLDPVYTGSSTMYSTDIKGLQDYRTQTFGNDGDDTSNDDAISQGASAKAQARRNELINLFREVDTDTGDTFYADYETMINAINVRDVSDGYIEAIFSDAEIAKMTDSEKQTKARAQLKADYEKIRTLFEEELGRDYAAAKDSYTEEPYKSAVVKDSNGNVISTGFGEIVSFMNYEGYVEIKYVEGADGKVDKTKIDYATLKYNQNAASTKEAAISYVYNDKINTELDVILRYWASGNTLFTEFVAKGKEIMLQNNKGDGDSLDIPNISGIVSLGHTSKAGQTIVVNDNSYTIATGHNDDGTTTNENEYDVLQITINGVDPKAVWNFAFSVAPQHYYAPGYNVDIKNNKFGVEYGSFDFMKNVIQSTNNIRVPLGAGAYQATNASNTSSDLVTSFYSNNVVYFKRNENFHTVGTMENAKIEKVRYQVVSASNAINALETGSVHYISPQYTKYNMEKLNGLASNGIVSMSTTQLGYGYIGINAGKVPDIELRKAIMAAMDTALAIEYYQANTAETIYWPMSLVSWAYPKDELGDPDQRNGKEYIALNFDESDAKDLINDYMQAAGASEGDSRLKLTFTIAGANVEDHPCYQVFIKAQKILNDCGWDVQVVPDTQALTKLATGSLAVWAAAWGSTIDPDLYQVYHKNSTATSTYAWGYREILSGSESQYGEEKQILNELSELIDDARETESKTERSKIYKKAMSLILDLAVELPVYQRDVLYAYNSKVIDSDSIPSESELNPYSSPLDRIWELEFAE